ncbi:hypothetical protein QOZ80_7BG0590980 [Eleusine coracana subsp. coracana]|nr:hypothetical protein QOZ80_7BG0590980 [Eleusine coracana subsp. coracana]
MAAPTSIAGKVTVDGGILPSDILLEILLRLPGRTLCRFRAVCRAWRSMLSHRAFAAAHVSRHDAPLVTVAVINDDATTMDFLRLDMSVNKIRRVPAGSWSRDATLCTHHHLAEITLPMSSNHARFVDLESGAVSLAPLQLHAQDMLPEAGRHGFNLLDGIVSFDLGSEKWSPTVIPGPLSSRLPDKTYPIGTIFRIMWRLYLTALNGNLVVVHQNVEKHLGFCTMDLWFCTGSSLAAGNAQWHRYYSVYYGDEIDLRCRCGSWTTGGWPWWHIRPEVLLQR